MISPATINTLAGCGWVSRGESLCLIGDSGTGKSYLLIALGTEAARAGHRVRYVLAAKLVNELAEAADDRQLSRTIARYGRVDLPARPAEPQAAKAGRGNLVRAACGWRLLTRRPGARWWPPFS